MRNTLPHPLASLTMLSTQTALARGSRGLAIAALSLGAANCAKPQGPGALDPGAESAPAPSSVAQTGSPAASGVKVSGYYAPTWGDSSGKDGAGGTKLTVNGEGRLPLAVAGFDKAKRGDRVTQERPEWQLFHGPEDQSLALEWIWVTKPDDKFFGRTWGGGGVAFNGSWVSVDGSEARYLVLWVKASEPGVDLGARLHSAMKSKGQEDTGELSLGRFVPGGRIDGTWRRAVIPLSEFPNVAEVELKGLQQVMFVVKPTPPENQSVAVFIDNVYLTNAELVTPATNLGALLTAEGLRLEWHKDPGEKFTGFAIAIDGKNVAQVSAKERSFTVPKSAFGSAPFVASVATVGKEETSEPQTLRVNPNLPAAAPATLSLGAPAHAISPHVLGVNWAPLADLAHLGATGNRWGGNRTSKYNWKEDIDSAGSDWFFLNDHGKPAGTPEEEKGYYRFIKRTRDAKVAVNFTIPIGPFVAKKHPTEGQRYCSFPTSLYPDQERTDGQGCGNGRTSAKKPIWDNDPNLGMVKNSPELQKAFVTEVVKRFGRASAGGVEFWSMDNEPGLWMHTHRDTVPKGVSAEELARRNIEYALAVKSVDPTAKVIAFAAWGVKALAGSNVDYFKPGVSNPERIDEDWSFQESARHGGDSQLVYLLKEFKKAEQTHKKRLIDVVDIHWYHELYAKDAKGETQRTLNDLAYDPVFAPVQFEALREWWDPSFALKTPMESWTYNPDPQKDRLWRPYHPVIPALKSIIEKHYPGTELAINEYDNGSPEHYHGALLRAAALGIFMQEGLFMAQNWHQTGKDKFVYWAQKLFGNYDDRGGRVGGKFVPVKSDNPDLYAFGAKDRGTTRIVLVNRQREKPIAATLELPAGASRARTFTLAESLGLRLLEQAPKPSGKTLSVPVPPFSAVLVELR